MAVANLDDPSALSHLIAGALRIKTEEKQQLLEEVDVARRLRRLSEILARELEVVAIGSRIQSQVQSEIDKVAARVRPAPAAEGDPGGAGRAGPRRGRRRRPARAARGAPMLPEEARKQVERELARLEKLPQAAAEHGVIRTYLEWIAELPWDSVDRGQPRPQARARRCSTPTTTTSSRSRTASSSSSRCASCSRDAQRLDPLPRRPARRRQDVARASRSRARSGASSSASASAACATRRRSAATGAPTSARCPA